MATVTYIQEHKQSPSAMRGVINYCCQKQKTLDPVSGRVLIGGIHCGGANAYDEFMLTKQVFGKTGGVNFYQYTQSFDSLDTISFAGAHALALKFAESAWPGHEVLVCTHCDTDNPHSHFVVNSVSWQNGRKLRQNPATLRQLRELSDELCLAHGLPVIEPTEQKGPAGMSAREYRSAVKGESWKLRLMFVIDECMKRAKSRREFFELMRRAGYEVRWTEDRKYITYTTPTGMRCRDFRLHEEKYLKGNMEDEFKLREELVYGRAEETERGRPLDRGPGRTTDPSEREELDGGFESAGQAEHAAARAADGAESTADTAGGAETARSDSRGHGAVRGTGWEAERAVCFQRDGADDEYKDLDWQTGTYNDGLRAGPDTESQCGDFGADPNGEAVPGDGWRGDGVSGGLADALVRLGHSAERIADPTPVKDATTMPAQTDRKRRGKEQEKKIALGHKEDDREERQSYDGMTAPW